jgi:hypothetical protein
MVPMTTAMAITWMASTVGMALSELRSQSLSPESLSAWMMPKKSTGILYDVDQPRCHEPQTSTS